MAGTMVQLCRSTDTGAPSLSGTAGSLITLLDACLLNGYNFKTVTSITRAGQTATVYVQTGHGLPVDGGPKVKLSGANQSEYNGNFQYTYVDPNYFTITVTGSPASPATGSINSSIAPLGWTKPFSGTNTAAYQSPESNSTKMYCRIDDTGTNYARIVGCESMISIDSYSRLFPTATQRSGGLWITKSNTADTVSRAWEVVGDGYSFFLFTTHGLSTATNKDTFYFGDPCSEMLSDPYGCLIYGNYNGNVGNWPGANSYAQNIQSPVSLIGGDIAHYFARNYMQTGTACLAMKHGNYTLGGNILGYNAVVPYPNPADNGLHVSPIFVTDPYCVRAQLKGLWQPLHVKPLGHGYLLPATQSPIGRRLYSIATASTGSTPSAGESHLDIDGPWR